MAKLDETEQAQVRRATEILAWVNDYAYRERDCMDDMLLHAMANATSGAAKQLRRVARAYRSQVEKE